MVKHNAARTRSMFQAIFRRSQAMQIYFEVSLGCVDLELCQIIQLNTSYQRRPTTIRPKLRFPLNQFIGVDHGSPSVPAATAFPSSARSRTSRVNQTESGQIRGSGSRSKTSALRYVDLRPTAAFHRGVSEGRRAVRDESRILPLFPAADCLTASKLERSKDGGIC